MRNQTYCRLYNQKGRVFLTSFKPSHKVYNTPGLKVSASLDTLTTVLYWDADTHTTGKTEDVHALFRRLRQHFPNMPLPVVDSRGGSGWLIVDTHIPSGQGKSRLACTEVEYNDTLRKLEDWFQQLGADLDIEHIEIKGKVYERNFGAGRLLSVKAGDLLKVPPSEEWLTQPSVNYSTLKTLAESTVATTPVNPPSPQPPQADKVKARKTGGSFQARILTDTQFDNLDTVVAQIDRLLPDRPLKAGRYAMTDRACAEMLVALCVLPPNDDDSAPYRRYEAFINRMEGEGIFKTRFQYERFKAMRDYLDGASLMEWLDHTYAYAGTGRKATRWKVVEGLKAEVLAVLEGKATKNNVTLIRTRKITVPVCLNYTGKKPYERLQLIGQRRQKDVDFEFFKELDAKVRLAA